MRVVSVRIGDEDQGDNPSLEEEHMDALKIAQDFSGLRGLAGTELSRPLCGLAVYQIRGILLRSSALAIRILKAWVAF